MTIISILNQKGGVGKTTLSVNLSRYFYKTKNQKVLLVDSDGQGSALKWHQKNDGELLDMICLNKPTISKDVIKFKHIYEKIFIDGIPQISDMSIVTLTCSDIVLIPVTPSPYDIWATQGIVDHIKERQLITDGFPRSAFIISRKIVNTTIGREIKDQLEQYELPIFESFTSQRVVYAESVAQGYTVIDIPGATAAQIEIENIGIELEEFIYGIY